jgi:hypothetical protein
LHSAVVLSLLWLRIHVLRNPQKSRCVPRLGNFLDPDFWVAQFHLNGYADEALSKTKVFTPAM